MIVHRISKAKHIEDLSGEGARLHGGRWNPKGYAVLYTSENRALAALEVLVHLNRETIPDDLKIISLEIPDNEIEVYDEEKFNAILKHENVENSLKNEGKNWLESKRSLALKIPSVLIRREQNILINPLHSAFPKVKKRIVENFYFDKRFFEQ